MMGGSGGGAPAAAGGPARHIPVLGSRAVEYLGVRAGGIYIDTTFGAGGYARAILASADAKVIGIDRDASAIAQGTELPEKADGRLVLVQDRFSNLASVARRCGHPAADGVVLDLGVSSMQLDAAERGFSFRLDGPLDMRMDRSGPSAADVIAAASERELASIIFALGEERQSRLIARAIVRARSEAPIRSTRELAAIIERVVRSRPDAIHPATRTFQALRIFVNEELAELAAGLMAAESVLKPGGRLVVVAFHSLEDRIVKTFLVEHGRPAGPSRHRPAMTRSEPTFRLLTGRPVTPNEQEITANPRARSAKLRAAERTSAPSGGEGRTNELLPRLPSLGDMMKRR